MLLKVLGWIFIPYIMLIIKWKKLNIAVRSIAVFWSFFIILATIGGMSSSEEGTELTATKNSSQVSDQAQQPTTSPSPTLETESVVAVEDKATETPIAPIATKDTTLAPTGVLSVHYIDVGQGASQLVIAPNGNIMLIDGGNNDDEKRVVDYLKAQGIKKVDILVGTHPDADHIGGLDAVVDAFEIGSIYMPKVTSNTKTFESLLTSISNKSLKVTTAKAGIDLKLDDQLTVNMVAPIGTYDDSNEMSAVIKLSFGDTSFLFTGDAEAKSENDLLAGGTNLKSDVLLVGHHGSNSSNSNSFLDAVSPEYGVIQVGKNSYGHPTSETLEKLSGKGIKIFRNDEQGTIIFSSDGKNVTTSQAEWKSIKTSATTKPATTEAPKATTKPKATQAPVTSSKPTKEPAQDYVSYANCAAVREAGAAPLYEGDPGYSTKLDRDKDGVACEK